MANVLASPRSRSDEMSAAHQTESVQDAQQTMDINTIRALKGRSPLITTDRHPQIFSWIHEAYKLGCSEREEAFDPDNTHGKRKTLQQQFLEFWDLSARLVIDIPERQFRHGIGSSSVEMAYIYLMLAAIRRFPSLQHTDSPRVTGGFWNHIFE
ncbi:hypothetical protein LZ30DRAFT_693941 [Colletotrichum cereale]|nr:hypothetical protein LZ30DRAFT_693941 [Colletotrichum cereale]